MLEHNYPKPKVVGVCGCFTTATNNYCCTMVEPNIKGFSHSTYTTALTIAIAVADHTKGFPLRK